MADLAAYADGSARATVVPSVCSTRRRRTGRRFSRQGRADPWSRASRPPSRVEGGIDPAHRRVIFAASLGTVFEWYDFYLYGALSAIISKQFFSGVNETTGFIFALLAFAAGFFVRPFGALVFGRLGDLVGRKHTFLITIVIMGMSTFLVGCCRRMRRSASRRPILLVTLRLLQGLALGGEYGGAAIYVAEHAPAGRRGRYTSWIQTTATLGLFLSLLVILGVPARARRPVRRRGAGASRSCYRSCCSRSRSTSGCSSQESPVFQEMKAEGKLSKAPLTEVFGRWSNLKLVLLALFGATAGQAVVWYGGQFYALFFLEKILQVEPDRANLDHRGRARASARRSSSCSARCRIASAARRSSWPVARSPR